MTRVLASARRRVCLLLCASACANGQSGEATSMLAAPVIAGAAGPATPALVVVERVAPEFSSALAAGVAGACGSCHDSRLTSANAEALAVFDLADPSWLVALPEARRACTLDRIGGDTSVTAPAKAELAKIVADLRGG